jgi:transmembrane sensor
MSDQENRTGANAPDEHEPQRESDLLAEALGRPDAAAIVHRAAENEILIDRAMARVASSPQEIATGPLAAPLRPADVIPISHSSPARLPGRRPAIRVWQIAALVLFAAGVAVFQNFWNRAPIPPAAPTLIATTVGQRAETRLPDGTRVILAPATKLTVSPDFATGKRELTLEGEAYFDVAPDPARPFTVKSAYAVVQDLGTAFAVRSYSDDPETRVSVRTGRVRVSAEAAAGSQPQPAVDLVAGDGAHVDAHTRVIRRTTGDTANALAWLNGDLVFEHAKVSEVVAELGRWYDLEIHVLGASVLGQHLSFRLASGATASDAIATLASLTATRFHRDGRVVTLKKGQKD